MPRSIQCPDCRVVLNVPDAAVGRRLKCPKCGIKFTADGGPAPQPVQKPAESGRSASYSGVNAGHNDRDLPTAGGTLRETFDLISLGEDLPPSKSPAGPSDALALFKDDPPSRRKPLAAEGRAKARRCPTCGGFVPQGMSLCSTCGLDLETGARIDLTDDLDTVPGPQRPSGPPIGVMLVGGISIAVSLVFTIIALMRFQKGETGYAFLMFVCLFGIYAAIQFLRSKSVKLLMVALTLGAMIDVVALIALPVFQASAEIDVKEQIPASDDEADIRIAPVSDRVDMNLLTWGIAILAGYAAVSLYLNSPPIRRHFK